jgi:hypothetical protein
MRRIFLALGVEQAYKLALLISRVPFFFFPIMPQLRVSDPPLRVPHLLSEPTWGRII